MSSIQPVLSATVQDSNTEDMSADSETDKASSSKIAHLTLNPQQEKPSKNDPPRKSSATSSKSQKSSSSQKSIFSNIPKFDSKDWFKHKNFDRYWAHYRYVSNWYGKHCHMYKSLQRKLTSHLVSTRPSYQTSPYYSYPYPMFAHPSQTCSPYSWTSKQYHTQRRRGGDGRSIPVKRRQGSVGMDIESDGDVVMGQECRTTCDTSDASEAPELIPIEELSDSVQMDLDISEEMLDFFATTRKHRQEREAEKKADKQKQKEDQRINIEEVTRQQKERTSAAPSERPGARRTTEMKLLYGKGAAMIHGMETALQMTFDRNFDVNQPNYWPNMPFKIKFFDA